MKVAEGNKVSLSFSFILIIICTTPFCAPFIPVHIKWTNTLELKN